jgi:O-antigen ligase
MAVRLESLPWAQAIGVAGLCAVCGLIAGVEPIAAMAVALGLAFLLLAFTDLTAGLVVFMLVFFLVPGTLVKPLVLGVLVLAISWLLTVATRSDDRSRVLLLDHPMASYFIVLFLAWGTISVTWAESTGDAIADLYRYLTNIVLFVIVYTAVGTRRRAAWVLGGYILGAVLTSAYGFVAPPSPDPEAIDIGERFTGGLGDPNILAAALIPGLALAVGAVGALRNWPGLRVAAICAAAVCLIGFFLTVSRGGLVALGVALVASIAVAGRWRAHAAVGVATLGLVAALYFGAFAPADARERLAQPFQGETRSQESRLTIWQVGRSMVADRPLNGVGIGNFETSSIHYVFEPGRAIRTDVFVDTPEGAHNTYLHVVAEVGFVGLVPFLAILAFSIGCTGVAVRNFKRSGDDPMEIMSRALLVAQAAILAASFFISAQSINKLWLLLGLGPALLAVSRTAGPSPSKEREVVRR